MEEPLPVSAEKRIELAADLFAPYSLIESSKYTNSFAFELT